MDEIRTRGRFYAVRLDTADAFEAEFSTDDVQDNHILGLLMENSATAVTVERWGQEQWRYVLIDDPSVEKME